MIIKLYEGDDIRVADTRGQAIKSLVQNGAEWIDIDGALYRVSNIHTIIPSSGQTSMVGGVSQKRNLMPREDRMIPNEPT